MGILSNLTVARYVRAIKQSPREIIFSRRLLVSAALYATAGVPISMWHPHCRLLGFVMIIADLSSSMGPGLFIDRSIVAWLPTFVWHHFWRERRPNLELHIVRISDCWHRRGLVVLHQRQDRTALVASLVYGHLDRRATHRNVLWGPPRSTVHGTLCFWLRHWAFDSHRTYVHCRDRPI